MVAVPAARAATSTRNWTPASVSTQACSEMLPVHTAYGWPATVSGNQVAPPSNDRVRRADKPLAVPVMLEIGKEMVQGEAQDFLLSEAADDLIHEAMGGLDVD